MPGLSLYSIRSELPSQACDFHSLKELTIHYGGAVMPKIDFRGKTYNSEFEMPPDVRQAYNEEKERSADKSGTSAKSLTDLVEMSPEMKEIYERAVEKVD